MERQMSCPECCFKMIGNLTGAGVRIESGILKIQFNQSDDFAGLQYFHIFALPYSYHETHHHPAGNRLLNFIFLCTTTELPFF